ncbi:MAG: hypothetical protein JW760_05145 [Spirochaetales bacterium]|nr:hypothetical protein [Spirochaetales bacterium]
MKRLRIFLIIPMFLPVSCDLFFRNSGRSPYIAEVFEYRYGVGQHASLVVSGEEEKKFLGTDTGFVLLGGWGGYIVAGFDHDVFDGEGYDFAVYTQPGVGSEPAVVFVMADESGTGRPEGTWYELSGSETGKSYGPDDSYIRDYRVTFNKPDSEAGNITWTDNQGSSGELAPGYGDSSYHWWWSGYGTGVTEVEFSGARLPHNKYLDEGFWTDYPDRFLRGYGENYQGEDLLDVPFGSTTRRANRFDIGDAVDAEGNPVELTSIRFIKIQTGVFMIAGELNEISTEVSGAVDLHALEDPALREKP